jgi:thiol:disulfide interchange protein DsbD
MARWLFRILVQDQLATARSLVIVLLGLVGAGPVLAQDDPFASQPSAAAKPASGRKDPSEDRIDFQIAVEPKQARRGETVRVSIRGVPRPGYHTYPLTMRSSDPSQDPTQLCQLTYERTAGLLPLWPVSESQPEFGSVEGVGTFLEHSKAFTWSQDILVLPDAEPGTKTLRVRIKLLACDQHVCVPGNRQLQTDLDITAAPAVPLSADLRRRMEEPAPAITVVPVPTAAGGVPTPEGDSATAGAPPALSADPAAQRGLAALLIASMGAAVAMLLTPCVFPMVPITVSFFLKQSEREHHNALLTAAVYSLTIIVVLAAAVLVLGQIIVQLANNAWLNLALGALLIFFALSLFGMYEIELPSSLAQFTSAREGRGGYIGAVFMALTFTITSFTCTGPFLGPLLVAVKEYQLGAGERVLAALCYAATFAAPFFVLALFPSLLKKLPKSGGWLNAVKVVLGFLELAAALKFLGNTDLAWNPGNPLLFNYETVLCAWIALSVACGLYLLGLFRLPHDTPVDHIGVVRMLLASIFLGLGLYMMPALWRVTPQGLLGGGLVAFLPLDTRIPVAGGGQATSELTWDRDYEGAWRLASRDGKLIFIDFTGQNCTNCRYNEKNVFPEPAIRRGLEKYVRVQLYTDFVPDPRLSRTASQEQAQQNSELQSETFGDVANPLYAIIRPDVDRPFDKTSDGRQKLRGEVLGVRKGLISRAQLKDFEEFLTSPQRAIQAAGTNSGAGAAGMAALPGRS